MCQRYSFCASIKVICTAFASIYGLKAGKSNELSTDSLWSRGPLADLHIYSPMEAPRNFPMASATTGTGACFWKEESEMHSVSWSRLIVSLKYPIQFLSVLR